MHLSTMRLDRIAVAQFMQRLHYREHQHHAQ